MRPSHFQLRSPGLSQRCTSMRSSSTGSCSSSSCSAPAQLKQQHQLQRTLQDWRCRLQRASAASHTSRHMECASTQPAKACSSSSGSGSGSRSRSSNSNPRRFVLQPPAALSDDVCAAVPAGSTAVVAGQLSSSAQAQPEEPPTAAAAAAGLHVGQVVQVCCARLGTGGVGVCLWGPSQLVLLVKGALPGEQLTAEVTAVKKSYAEARKRSTLKPHTDAAPPACQHYGTCGGCSLQALSYPAQLAHKADYVGQVLTRVGKLDAAAVAATRCAPVPAAAVYGYRNKVQLAFSSLVWQPAEVQQQRQQDGAINSGAQQKQDGAVGIGVQQQDPGCGQGPVRTGGRVIQGWGLGYFLPGSNSVVVDVSACALASPAMNQVITQVRHLCQQHDLQPFNSTGSHNVLRHLIIRSASASAAAAVQPTTSAAAMPATPPVAAADVARKAAALGAAARVEAPAATAAVTESVTANPQLMAVLVTTAAIHSQPSALQALSAVADDLMASCPGLVSVVHSTEAAAAGAANTRRGRSSRSSSNSSRRPAGRNESSQGHLAASTGPAHKESVDSGSSSSSSSRGAQALRVQSSAVLRGTDSLQEALCGLQFQLSPHSFFQTNTAQAQQLYQLVVTAVAQVVMGPPRATAAATAAAAAAGGVHVAGTGGGVILDLYCGTGTIALCLAAALPQHAVVGFDVSASSIADAKANAIGNSIGNVSFVCGDLDQLLPAGPTLGPGRHQGSSNTAAAPQQGRRAAKKAAAAAVVQGGGQQGFELQGLQPRVVVVDPARSGLGPGVVQFLLRCGCSRVVYVSCNAATQARDLQRLCGGGVFQLTSWSCVDLFPQTDVSHVETLVVLDRAACKDS